MDGYESVDGIGRLGPGQQDLRGFVPLVLLAQVLGLCAVVMTAVWMGSMWQGFSWSSEQVFNYHPLFMVIGLIFLYADAILVYRVFRNSPKLPIKLLHGGMHVLALVFAAIGLKAVFESHSKIGAPNMYSLHSWLGISAVALFGIQWLIGFITFLFPKLPDGPRAAVLPLHATCGMFIFGLALATALIGITEKNTFSKDPYSKLHSRELLGNFLGIVLVVFGIIVLYVVSKRDYRRVESLDEERIVLHD